MQCFLKIPYTELKASKIKENKEMNRTGTPPVDCF